MSLGQANLAYPISPSTKVSTIFPGDNASCDEGSFFVSTLAATASTAVACTSQALADTNPALAIYNGQPVGTNSANIYLRYIKCRMSVVAGSNTHLDYSLLVDNLAVKLTTAGTALGTPASTNTNSGVLSKMSGYGGVNIAAAQTAAGRRVGAGSVENGLPVAFDSFIFTFGEPVFNGAINGTQTNVKNIVVPCAPVILAPGWWFTLGLWGASQAASAATLAFEIGYIERPAGQ